MDAFGSSDDLDLEDPEMELDDDDAIEFDRDIAEAMYREGMYTTDPARWERIREVIPFDDLVTELHGTHATVISCPFHGRDSKPSFNIYRRTNDAYCFGCPDGHKYYDSVRFAAAKLEISRKEALEWLERKYNLPPMADLRVEQEEYLPPPTVELTFNDLRTPYKLFVRSAVRQKLLDRVADIRKTAQTAEAFLYVYFSNSPDRSSLDAPGLPLAQVLGSERTQSLLSAKATK
jgi:DNA primase